MISFFIGFFTIFMLLLCCFVVLLVLMQRPSANAGIGSSLGGGMAETALGVEAGNVLTRWTIYGTVAFFVVSFLLFLAYMSRADTTALEKKAALLPQIQVTEEAKKEQESIRPGSLTELPSQQQESK